MTSPHEETVRCLRNTLLAAVAFAIAVLLVHLPHALDIPFTLWVNSFANRYPALDQTFFIFDNNVTVSGVILLGLLWAEWYRSSSIEHRARLIGSTSVLMAAGLLSRGLQMSLRSHPRPMFDPAILFHRPQYFPISTNTWNSFPSDHVTVFGGLVALLFMARAPLRWPALCWIALVESGRIYSGFHYPADILGGAALGSFAVWITPLFRQATAPVALGRRIAHWSERNQSLFYGLAFFASYQIATLTVDIRDTLYDLRHLH